MNQTEQKAAAKRFAEYWKDRGDEKQETARFWIELLGDVLGAPDPTKFIEFEKPVAVEKNQKYIDGYIMSTRVLIEQKGAHVSLGRSALQSDGEKLTPYGQAFRYNNFLPYEEKAKWIIVSNFREILIYNMNTPNGEPEHILLNELPKEYHRLMFLTDTGDEHIRKEEEVSLRAGELVGKLYNAILARYKNPESPKTLESLNMLCVRLVFCLYAEDAGIFGKRDMFADYLRRFEARDVHKALRELFKVLDMNEAQREEYDPYMDEALSAFPYVNGGLFEDESIEIPNFTEEIKELLIEKASLGFDWSEISPTIFGAVFESTLNPDTRRSGGMHYTSIKNIHKVIDPLFLNELRAELEEIKKYKQISTIRTKVLEFQKKLASLTFFDPACGSGNFLTETYISLRKLENEAIMLMQKDGQIAFDTDMIKVSISSFYGIEINDFAVAVAKTALWIAESQMKNETEGIVHMNLQYLPLKTIANIHNENALRVDWEKIVPKDKLNYIIGNPPFVGYSLQSREQKNDILSIYVDEKGKPYKTAGKIDYVAGWYFKASELMQNTNIRTAFVSTNSITQGEQVAGVWKPLYDRFGIHIDFAHRSFIWDSEASLKAHVHCVIIGFSIAENKKKRALYSSDCFQLADNINAYLIEAPDIFIESNKMPICDIPDMVYGNKPTDGGFLFLTAEEKDKIIYKEPNTAKFIRKIFGATEYINNKERFCIWLTEASPAEIHSSKILTERIEKVKEFRLNSTKEATRKSAETPTLFQEIRQPSTEYIIIPRHSSENRKYIPLGFISPEIIVNDAVQIVQNATLYHFGILTSTVHMAWTRVVCGRIKSDYRYSKDIVYNNFPWCTPTPEQKAKIEQTAQAILDARALYPDCSLADLYDELTMPAELRKAHKQNDLAVISAYGFDKNITESEIVAELMKMYKEMTS